MALSKPAWFKVRLPEAESYSFVASSLRRNQINTICQAARCPNRVECWSSGTATFLILGTRCTRSCLFCAVTRGNPLPVDPEEPKRLAEVTASLNLGHVVITSVTRDDLEDGGASWFAATLAAIRETSPSTTTEVLIPDFQGWRQHLKKVLAAGPDVINHNLEVPARLYPLIGRPEANYGRSLGILRQAKQAGFITKSGLMVGLGETNDDLRKTLLDLRQAGCDLLTIGQYLQPTRNQLPVKRFYRPEEFAKLEEEARLLGFRGIAAGPLVRSSYLAHELLRKAKECAS